MLIQGAGVDQDCAAIIAEDLWLRLLARDAATAPPLYAPLLTPATAIDGCFVIARMAQSLDGRIATANGSAFWIGGEHDVLHTHRLRALCDAVVVGAGTVRADDPLLTTRHCSGPSPVRVVIDTERRLPENHRLFDAGPATLLLCAEDVAGGNRHGDAELLAVRRAADRGLDVRAIVAAAGIARPAAHPGRRRRHHRVPLPHRRRARPPARDHRAAAAGRRRARLHLARCPQRRNSAAGSTGPCIASAGTCCSISSCSATPPHDFGASL